MCLTPEPFESLETHAAMSNIASAESGASLEAKTIVLVYGSVIPFASVVRAVLRRSQ